MKDLIEGLTYAHALISDPARHIRGQYARDADHHVTSPYLPDAYKFCSIGAVMHVFRTSYAKEEQALRLLRRFMTPNFETTLNCLNDLLTHDQLMARWTQALTNMKNFYEAHPPAKTL